jgi:hypothetical protein
MQAGAGDVGERPGRDEPGGIGEVIRRPAAMWPAMAAPITPDGGLQPPGGVAQHEPQVRREVAWRA